MPRCARFLAPALVLLGLVSSRHALGTPDGYFDTTWAGSGYFTFDGDYSNPGNLSSVDSIATETTGRLFLSGRAAGAHQYWWLGELFPEGQFVPAFGANDLSGRITSCSFVSCSVDDPPWMSAPYVGSGYLDLAGSLVLTTDNAHSLAASTAGTVVVNDKQGSVTAHAIAVQSDGKILAAGIAHYSTVNTTPQFGVARFNSGLGSLDHAFNAITDGQGTTFDGGATVTVDMGDTDERADAVLVQPNGRIVLVGRGTNSVVDSEDLELVALHADGSLDPTFGDGGIKKYDVGDRVVYVNPVVDRGGQLWIAIQGATNPFLFLIVRLSADGNAALGHVVDTAATGCGFHYVIAVAVDSAGRVLAAGTCYVAARFYFIVVRLRGDTLALDTSFGNNGISLGFFSDTSTQDYGYSIAFDAGGRPVVGGNSTPSGALNPKAGIARLTYDLIFTNDYEQKPRGCLLPNCT